LTDLTGRLDSAAAGTKEIKAMSDSIGRRITAIEEALYQTKSKSGEDMLNYPIRLNDKIAGIYHVAASGYNVPSKQAREVFGELSALTDVQLAKLKKIMNDDLPVLNKMIHDRQVPVIGIKD
jgi:hypothetical protein